MHTIPVSTVLSLSPESQAFLAAMNAPGVHTARVAWSGNVQPAAANKAHTLVKRVEAIVTTGVAYRDLAVNNDRETGSLPWGEWVAYPYIIRHKDVEYARLYTVDGTLRSTYYVDGREVRKSDFDALLTASARSHKRPHGGTLTVKVANLTVL